MASQLADLRVQALHIGEGSRALTRRGEQTHRALQELRLPLRDLVGVDIKLLHEFRERSIVLQGRERHLGFEGGCVISSRAFHDLLSL
jgi:hypothetical protein